MSNKQNPSAIEDRERLERSIVLQLLRDDHNERWSREDLARELPNVAPAALDDALCRLEGTGLLRTSDGRFCASRAARRLDELGLIGV
jgi:DNA-binding HxlR family transcriptional regulator